MLTLALTLVCGLVSSLTEAAEPPTIPTSFNEVAATAGALVAVSALRPGDAPALTVRRGGRGLVVSAKLAEDPDSTS